MTFFRLLIFSFFLCLSWAGSAPYAHANDAHASKAGEELLKNLGTKPASAKSFFGPKKAKPVIDGDIARQMAKVAKKKPKPQLELGDENLSFRGSEVDQSDGLIASRRSTFPGGKDTLSQIDEEEPSELNVIYKLDEKAAARLAINEQNINSTTYTPIKKDEGINAAGVYLDVDLEEDLQLRLGGEVRQHETNSPRDSDQSSQGASVGMKWVF